MPFKIGQMIITIMNVVNIFVQHMYTNVSPFPFAPPIIPLIYVPGHDLN